MSNLLRTIILFALLCALSTTATADAFYEAYQRGLAAFKAKNYTDARSEFLRAYDLRPEPIILFNVAQTYRLELDSQQALIYYRRFLAESRIAEDLRDEAQAYVAGLEAEQKARDQRKKLDADAGPKERDGTPVKVMPPPMDHRSPLSSVVIPSEPANDSTRPTTQVSEWSTKRRFAIGIAAAGALALGTGTVLGVMAKTKQNDAHTLCMDPQLACDGWRQANDLVRSGHALAIDANVAFGIGAVAAVTAGVLWFTGASESHHRVAVEPAISSGHLVVAAHGRF